MNLRRVLGFALLPGGALAVALAFAVAFVSGLGVAQQSSWYIYFGVSPSYFAGCAAVVVDERAGDAQQTISSLKTVLGRNGPYPSAFSAGQALSDRGWTGGWPYFYRQGSC